MLYGYRLFSPDCGVGCINSTEGHSERIRSVDRVACDTSGRVGMPEEVKERLSRCHHVRKYPASYMAVVLVEDAIGREMSHQDRTLVDQMFDLVQQYHLEIGTEVGTDCTIAYKWNSSNMNPFQMQVDYVLVGVPFEGIVISWDHQDRLASGIQRIHRSAVRAPSRMSPAMMPVS